MQFRVGAVSRTAPIPKPVIELGFLLLRGHEGRVFLDSTDRRMRELTALALGAEAPGDAIREAGPEMTARRFSDDDAAHEQLARRVEEDSPAA